MAKSIVIYTSKRGSTKQYAEWIAEELACEALPLSDAKNVNLYEYDCIIYGGWIRGSGIVDFDKFGKMLDDELMQKLIVFGVGMADETPDNYMQVWSLSIGKLDPKNQNKSILYILGGAFDPANLKGLDKFLIGIMRKVLISGSTEDAKDRANFMKDRIDNGVNLVSRDNIKSLVKDAKKKLASE